MVRRVRDCSGDVRSFREFQSAVQAWWMGRLHLFPGGRDEALLVLSGLLRSSRVGIRTAWASGASPAECGLSIAWLLAQVQAGPCSGPPGLLH